jgi:hypothetical protein
MAEGTSMQEVLFGKPEGRDHLEDLVIDEMTLLFGIG